MIPFASTGNSVAAAHSRSPSLNWTVPPWAKPSESTEKLAKLRWARRSRSAASAMCAHCTEHSVSHGASDAPALWTPHDRSGGLGASVDLEDVSGRAAIAGIGETEYTKASGRTAREIGAEAAERAIADAGLEPDDIDGLT